MEKKYNLPDENKQQSKLGEPAAIYERTPQSPVTLPTDEMLETWLSEMDKKYPNRPGMFTDEEKLQRIEQAIKDEEAGIYFTHEEIINKYKNRL